MKLLILIFGFWILASLQITKTQYRIYTWDINKSQFSSRISRKIEKDPALFLSLLKENITNPSMILEPSALGDLAGRLNQAMLVSHTMDFIPRRRDFGRGDVTIHNTVVALIPRIVWPEKPIVGQADYYLKNTGINLGRYVSSTLGPLGDAYADYGKYGIIFMAFFGLIIGFLFKRFVTLSMHQPSLLLWFMVIYVGSIAVSEVSVAGYLNSILKYLLLIFIVRFLFRTIFKLEI